MNKLFYILVVSVCVAFISSCKPQVPGEYLQPGEMEDILYDYHLAVGMFDEADEAKRAMCEASVLARHNVTEAEFDSSLVYYSRHADRFQKIYDNISKRLSNEAVSLGASALDYENLGGAMLKGDTANIWNDVQSVVLATLPPDNVKSFSLQCDTAFHAGDRIILSFNTQFVFQDGYKDGVALLAVQFANDSIATKSVHMSESSSYSVVVSDDSRVGIKSIRGFFSLQNPAGSTQTTLKLMFVENIKLVRCHVSESASTVGQDDKSGGSVDSITSVDKNAGASPSSEPVPVREMDMRKVEPVAVPERRLAR